MVPVGSTTNRFCPQCGHDSPEVLCPHDETPTVVRVQLQASDLQFSPGQVVAGRYKLAEALGRGGFGAVYKARHLATSQELAIKFLAIDFEADGDDAVRRFFQEAKVTSHLRHPNTVRVYDFGQTESGALFMAMELLLGPTLERLLRDRQAAGTALSEAETCDIGISVLRSLAEAHGNDLVHRDLKPANIMLAEVKGEEPVVKVLDFGIARTRNSSLTGGGKSLGTPTYMAPEQCAGLDIDGRADLYALGVVLFRCMTGQLPFNAPDPLAIMYLHRYEPPPDPRTLAPGCVSEGLTEIVLRAMAKTPEERFADARAMRQALEVVRGGAWAATPTILPGDTEDEGRATISLDLPKGATPTPARSLSRDAGPPLPRTLQLEATPGPRPPAPTPARRSSARLPQPEPITEAAPSPVAPKFAAKLWIVAAVLVAAGCVAAALSWRPVAPGLVPPSPGSNDAAAPSAHPVTSAGSLPAPAPPPAPTVQAAAPVAVPQPAPAVVLPQVPAPSAVLPQEPAAAPGPAQQGERAPTAAERPTSPRATASAGARRPRTAPPTERPQKPENKPRNKDNSEVDD